MSFPRYPKYKDSGVEWLGEAPKHWDVKRLKQACHVFPSNVDKKCHDGETPIVLCNYTDVYYNEKITRTIEFMAATASPEQIAKFTLRAGDTIITKDSETADDIAVAAYVPESLPGVVCGYHLSMVRPLPNTYGAFVTRLFGSVYAKSCFAILANGLTRVGLGQYELDNVVLPFPPFEEQKLIADFLDRETSKIDALVGEQRRLIELLKEKRQAVISHAVTKGLNLNAPLKPSGIEWLGDVPEHWNVSFLKYYVATINGFGFSSTDFQDDGVPFVRAGNIKNKSITQPDVFLPKEVVDMYRRVILDGGDIVISMVGSDPRITESAVGQVGIVPNSLAGAVPNQNVVILREDPVELRKKYLFYVLCSDAYRHHLNVYSHKLANQSIISSSLLVAAKFAFPDPRVQQDIIEFLDEKLAELESLTDEAERGIELLQERRTALISAAVTGKIDVRNLLPK